MIYLSTDHRGYNLMQKIMKYLDKKHIPYELVGAKQFDPTDSYADYTLLANEKVAQDKGNKGIYMCGTGLGTMIGANRNKDIRAVLCVSPKFAYYGRLHNDANVLVMSGNYTSFGKAKRIINTFLTTSFEGGRHIERIKKIS